MHWMKMYSIKNMSLLGQQSGETANDINADMRKAVFPVTVFVAIIAVFGFFGNLFVFYAFLFRYKKNNFRCFILCLAVTDLISCLTTIPGEVVSQFFWFIYPSRVLCKIKSWFNMFTVMAEALFLLAVAADRYRKICQPFAWQLSYKTVIRLCGGIFVVAFMVAFPVLFFWGTHEGEVIYRDTNVSVVVCAIDSDFQSTLHPLIYTIFIEATNACMLLAMTILNIFMIRRLYLQQKWGTDKKKTKRVRTDTNDSSHGESATDKDSSQTETTNDDSVKGNEKGSLAYKTTTPESSTSLSNTVNKQDIPNSAKHAADTRRPVTAIRSRVRRKTVIVLVITVIFTITIMLYMTLLNFIATGILQRLTGVKKAVYFFFFRLYFINHVINPLVYGLLDPNFRRKVVALRKRTLRV